MLALRVLVHRVSSFRNSIVRHNPDTNGDGTLTGDERVVWMMDGVAKWGEHDNLDEVFAAGVELAGNWWDNLDQAVLDANPTLGRCVDADTTVSANDAGTELIDIGCVDGAIAGLNYDIYSYAAPYGHIALQNGRIENEFDDWRIRFEYDVNPDWLTYATVATGHKSGGFNDNLAGTERQPPLVALFSQLHLMRLLRHRNMTRRYLLRDWFKARV